MDIILVTTPYGAREAGYRTARETGAAVMAEKPFARTLVRHQEISRGFEPHRLCVCHQRRYLAAAGLARSLVREGPFGPLTGVSCHFGGVGHRLGGGYASDFALAGGGLIFNLAVHDLDLSLFITDARRVAVREASMEFESGLDIHTRAAASVTLADGRDIPLTILLSALVETERSIRLDFEKLSVRLRPYQSDGGLEALTTGSGFAFRVGEMQTGARSMNQMLAQMWTEFRDGLASGVPGRVAARHTLLTTDLIEQLYAKAGAPGHPLDTVR